MSTLRRAFRSLRVHLGLGLACALAPGCTDSPGSGLAGAGRAGAPEHASEHAAGTVLALEFEGRRATITADQVDEWLDTIARIEPAATLPARRRLALTNIVLPLTVAGMIDPAAREEARLRAQDSWDVIQEGLIEYKDLAEMGVVEGGFKEAGLDTWGRALEMEVDEWSPIFETVGAFTFFRFVGVPEPPWDAGTPILIERALFPYLDEDIARDQIEDAFDRTAMTLVDPAWEPVVPAHYIYRMRPE